MLNRLLALACMITIALPASTARANDYKLVDPSDIYISYEKWKGRSIEVHDVQCIGDEENGSRYVRCLSTEAMVLFVFDRTTGLPEAFDKIMAKCETFKEGMSSKCKYGLRGSVRVTTKEQLDALNHRIVVGLADVTPLVHK